MTGSCSLPRQAWECGARTLVRTADLPGVDPAIVEALERLGDALDDVRELLEHEAAR